MFGDHGLGCLLKEGGHGKSPKCLDGNLGDFGEFCKGLGKFNIAPSIQSRRRPSSVQARYRRKARWQVRFAFV